MHRHQLSRNAELDIDSGLVDTRLIAALDTLAADVSLEIAVIKTGHPMGPTSPTGVMNNHFFCRE